MISWWNKRFSANNLILLTSAFGLGHKITLPQFTTFTGNNDLFLSALRASRNKRIIFRFKSFISSLDHYDLRIIIIISTPVTDDSTNLEILVQNAKIGKIWAAFLIVATKCFGLKWKDPFCLSLWDTFLIHCKYLSTLPAPIKHQ